MLLELKNGGFFYQKDKFIFKDLNFHLQKSHISAILGLNGRGKSTLLLNLMGLKALCQGKLELNGSFSYLPQSFFVAFKFSVLDIVIMGRIKNINIFGKPSKNDRKIALEALDFLGILGLKDRLFNSLSGGQKQLVLFARSVASKSDILFLDEPMSALDLPNQNKVLTLIKKLQEDTGLSVVFTTHDPRHALAIADETLIMGDECKFAQTSEVITEENLENLYNMKILVREIKDYDAKSLITIFDTQKRSKNE